MSKIILSLSILLAWIISASAQNTVSFDNQSGEPALVKLIGPTSSEIEVPNGTKPVVQVLAGKYFIKVRYGVQGKYHYTKGQEFTVDETATTTSGITITLHKVVNGNYGSSPISEQEFGVANPTADTNTSTPVPTPQPPSQPRNELSAEGCDAIDVAIADFCSGFSHLTPPPTIGEELRTRINAFSERYPHIHLEVVGHGVEGKLDSSEVTMKEGGYLKCEFTDSLKKLEIVLGPGQVGMKDGKVYIREDTAALINGVKYIFKRPAAVATEGKWIQN